MDGTRMGGTSFPRDTSFPRSRANPESAAYSDSDSESSSVSSGTSSSFGEKSFRKETSDKRADLSKVRDQALRVKNTHPSESQARLSSSVDRSQSESRSRSSSGSGSETPGKSRAGEPHVTHHDNPELQRKATRLRQNLAKLDAQITAREASRRHADPKQSETPRSPRVRSSKKAGPGEKIKLSKPRRSPRDTVRLAPQFPDLQRKKSQIDIAKEAVETGIQTFKEKRQSSQQCLHGTRSSAVSWTALDEQELRKLKEERSAIRKQEKALLSALNERANDTILSKVKSPETKRLHAEFEQARKVDESEQMNSLRKYLTTPLTGAWANLTAFTTGNTLAASLATLGASTAFAGAWSPWIGAAINLGLWTLFEPTHTMFRTVSVTSDAADQYAQYQTLAAHRARDAILEMAGIKPDQKFPLIDPSTGEEKFVSASEKLKSMRFWSIYLKKALSEDVPFFWYSGLLSIGLQLGLRKDLWARFGIGLASGACTMATSQLIRLAMGGKVKPTRSCAVWGREAAYQKSYIKDLKSELDARGAPEQPDPLEESQDAEILLLQRALEIARTNQHKANMKSNPVSSYLFELQTMWSKKGRADFIDLETPGRRIEACSALIGKAIVLTLMALIIFDWAQPLQEKGKDNPMEETYGNFIHSIGLIMPSFFFRQEFTFAARLLAGAGTGITRAIKACWSGTPPPTTMVTHVEIFSADGSESEERKKSNHPAGDSCDSHEGAGSEGDESNEGHIIINMPDSGRRLADDSGSDDESVSPDERSDSQEGSRSHGSSDSVV